MNKGGRPSKRSLAARTTLIRFTKIQDGELRKISEKEDISITSIVRTAVAKYLEGR